MQSSAPAPGSQSPWDSARTASHSTHFYKQLTLLKTRTPSSSRFLPPRRRDPHCNTSPAPTTTGCREDRCPDVSKQPHHSVATAKMSPHILICPEPVLTDHAPSQHRGSTVRQEKIQLLIVEQNVFGVTSPIHESCTACIVVIVRGTSVMTSGSDTVCTQCVSC